MRPYTDGPIGPLSYRYSSGVVRNPHSTSFNCAPTQFHHQCSCFHIMNDMLECYLIASNHQPSDCWRAHRVYNVKIRGGGHQPLPYQNSRGGGVVCDPQIPSFGASTYMYGYIISTTLRYHYSITALASCR